jgi:ATP-dependent helicase YprA (DUF1998 family)/very-short-patch-repair endonuclease
MDIFQYRNDLLGDYASYVKGFLEVQDSEVEHFINAKLDGGFLWPEPLVQLNPAFLPGPTIDDLVAQGKLDPICKKVFRRGKTLENPAGSPLLLHRHQEQALACAKKGANYVLTTGTGSGKSLTYIIPIVDHVLKNGSGKGVQAIVVYPMNALANSQLGEMEKFLGPGFPAGQPPVRFARYTGQENEEAREQLLNNPPDVLLTNYVMLELILTRPREREHLIKAAKGLKFLVLDELHTYRGRQGADVAMLVRRLRETLQATDLQFVGTSATMGSGATIAEIKMDVAAVASRLFGSKVEAEAVIGESLRRITVPVDVANTAALEALRSRVQDPTYAIPTTFEPFCKDPLAGWIETTFGLEEEPGTGTLRRTTPKTLEQAGKQLAEILGLDGPACSAAIQRWLLHGYKCEPDPVSGNRPFAFRLHQFISKGDAVYATLGKGEDRWMTLQPQLFRPEHRDERLFPLAFCRECGQEFYSVYLHERADGVEAIPRSVGEDESQDDHIATGYLMALDSPWPSDPDQELALLPDEWKEPWKSGFRIRSDRRDHRPRPYLIGKNGKTDGNGQAIIFLPTPFGFCPSCRVTYSARQRKDFGKLATLSSEGRSTATTILSLSAIRHLKTVKGLEARARKLLSFTDNRQDASLQAGHFNDFSEIGLMRAALFQALNKAGDQGLTHEKLSHAVFEALDLPFETYSVDPNLKFAPKEDAKQVLRDMLAYRLYRDLQRGWRINMPNLEQVGLLAIEYKSLTELSESEDEWAGKHHLLATGSPSDRRIWCRVLLDSLRRNLALKVDYLRADYQDQLKQRSSQRLKEPWAVDEDEKLDRATLAFPRQREKTDDTYRDSLTFVGPRSSFGQFLRREANRLLPGTIIKGDDLQDIIRQLFEVLQESGSGLLEIVEKGAVPGYQIPADALVWKVGSGFVPHDPLLQPSQSIAPRSPNPFFVSFYKETAQHLLGLQAREHTAQVPSRQREERENDFREGKLKILYCSPTMELGVDISDLNVVNLRNVPPTPANYAQRSGRAGRSGQPALVYTYCSTGSSHDQYFFKRPERMVAGRVATPRLDLANEDLIRSHIHAIWLAETKVDLKRSLRDILNLDGENPSLNILPSVATQMANPYPRAQTREKGQAILDDMADELKLASWYTPEWLDRVLLQLEKHFEDSCERWRTMYRSARNQQELQNKIILDHTRAPRDHEKAKRLRREAESQLKLLCESENMMQSDFYSYRYFASEGFLPGYNFPRLPLSAFIPGRRKVREKEGEEFLSRPRFLAISEFGPRAIVYHEGSRYEINKVILPVGDGPVLGQMKRCVACGYLHAVPEGQAGPDVCEHCGQSLGMPRSNMFRLQNVSTRRRERINSDEEERFRKGFELQTAIRFEERGGKPSPRKADLYEGTTPLAVLNYGDAATIWRVNLGMRRRDITKPDGFILDLERGLWETQEKLEASENGDAEELSNNIARVIPYVEDRRNCLLFTPFPAREPAFMASLQAALKNAIQVCFQLEDSELACESLPSNKLRTQILIYESAEGGAGVLRRLVTDGQTALIEVARTALELLHFDPATGDDRHFPKGSKEACEAACYDCLMSYGNQWDHELLDRHLIKDYLLAMSRGNLKVSSSAKSREDHYQDLIKLCDSKLEKDWLAFLYSKGLRLPTRSQVFFKPCMTRPDFMYDDHQAVVYVDGPPHDFPERQARDAAQNTCMADAGFQVIRFHHTDNWEEVVKNYPSVFGSLA